MSEKVLQNSVSELTRSIDWDYLEAQSIASFQAGLKEVQKENPDEIKKDLSLYSLVLKSKSLNFLDPQYAVPTISLEFQITAKNENMGLYKFLVDLDLSVLEDWLILD
tara:strand:+ start:33589 stop:33912 length:324 start_codon:yes stop_codon:yes gene_type:complete